MSIHNDKEQRLLQLKALVLTLPEDSLYAWRWKMEKAEFKCFSNKTEPVPTLNYKLETTVANPGVWYILLSPSIDREDLTLDLTTSDVQPAYKGLLGHKALAAFFRLTEIEEGFIFKGEAYWVKRPGCDTHTMISPTVSSVVDHIDKVLGGLVPVEWANRGQ